MPNELLPCPCCGSTHLIVRLWGARVRCSDCGLEGFSNLWNRRAQSPVVRLHECTHSHVCERRTTCRGKNATCFDGEAVHSPAVRELIRVSRIVMDNYQGGQMELFTEFHEAIVTAEKENVNASKR